MSKPFKQFTQQEKKQLKADLSTCDTVKDILDMLGKKFDLETKPGPLTKATLINGIVYTVLPLINPNTKD